MTVSPRRLIYLLIFSTLASLGYSQTIRSYKSIKVLSGETVDVPAESTSYPEFVRRPRVGSVSKFKYGYEDVYRVRYTAPSSYIGVDTIIYKTQRNISGRSKPFFEGFIVEVSPTRANADYYAIDLMDGGVDLKVLANDESVSQEMTIAKLSFVSNGDANITGGGGSIRFVPVETGYAKIGYTVCAKGDCSAGLVIIRVDDRRLQPKSDTTNYSMQRDESITLLVGPGFSPPSTAYFQGKLTKINNQIYEYKPALGYSGVEVLKFNELIGGVQYTHLINIEVKDPFVNNGWNSDDHFYTEIGNSTLFSLSANDVGGTIQNINSSGLKGTLSELGAGLFEFIPQPGFKGQTKFSYESCGEGRCDIANVYLTVHNYEPLYEIAQLYTSKNIALPLDYKVPIKDYRFEVIEQPSHGTIYLGQGGNLLSYQPHNNFTGQDLFRLRYCAGNPLACKNVSVGVYVQDITVSQCLDCVWPGDHNDNGQVDIQDAVVLATNIGYSGPSRAGSFQSGWYGQTAEDWPNALSYGTKNLKYVDGNGDGLISTADLQVLSQHYMKAHSIVPTPPPGFESVPLNVEVLTPTVEPGDWAVIQISLGTENSPVYDMLGFNFSLEMGDRFMDSSSVSFTLADDGIFNPTNSVIAFAKSPKDGTIDVGIGKIDKEPIRGHGVLGQIRFIVEEDLNGFRSLEDLIRIKLKAKRIGLHGTESLYSLDDSENTMLLQRKMDSNELIFPNPADSWIQLPEGVRSIRLFSSQGQLVMDLDQTRRQIDVSQLPVGLYILEMRNSDGKPVAKRLEIVR